MASKTSNPMEKESEVLQRRQARAMSPFEDMDRMFDSIFPARWPQLLGRGWPEWARRTETKIPAVDVLDQDSQVIVRAEVPGVKKEDLEISVTDNAVTIRGSTKREKKQEEGEYYRCEMSCGEFSRTVGLPTGIDSNKAKATFKDGILELTLPKVATSKRRSITVE